MTFTILGMVLTRTPGTYLHISVIPKAYTVPSESIETTNSFVFALHRMVGLCQNRH